MNIKPLYREIPLDRIDLHDPSYRLTPLENEELPDRSPDVVTRWGIIQPPVLLEKNQHFTPITGRRQIIAAGRVADRDSRSCLVLPVDTPPHQLLALALEEILLVRPASPIEKAVCWRKGVELLGRERAEEEFGPRLELSGQLPPEKLEKLLTLDLEMQKALHRGDLELKTGLKLLDLEKTDRAVLFEIIARLRLSSSNQRKIVDLCREQANRQGRSIAAILAEPECLEIVNQAEPNPRQKTAMLMNRLTALCYPRLSEAEEDFQGFVNRLGLPWGVAVDHAPSFEKDSLKLTIELADRQQLAEIWPAIKNSMASGKKG